MTLGQQYALDLYRATQHGTPPPPLPGSGDLAVLREMRGRRRRRGRGPFRRWGTGSPSGTGAGGTDS